MGENSNISWTDHKLVKPPSSLCFSQIASAFRLEVFKFMAVMAQRNPVRYNETHVRKFSKRFNVVRSQISSGVISTFLACVTVSFEDSESPLFIFNCPSVAEISLGLTMAKSIMFFTSRCAFFSQHGNAFLCFFCMPLTNPSLVAFRAVRHGLLGTIGMSLSLECRNASFKCPANFFSFRSMSTSAQFAF